VVTLSIAGAMKFETPAIAFGIGRLAALAENEHRIRRRRHPELLVHPYFTVMERHGPSVVGIVQALGWNAMTFDGSEVLNTSCDHVKPGRDVLQRRARMTNNWTICFSRAIRRY
jgi:hypothetical protein